jgi:hypothetical protein
VTIGENVNVGVAGHVTAVVLYMLSIMCRNWVSLFGTKEAVNVHKVGVTQ